MNLLEKCNARELEIKLEGREEYIRGWLIYGRMPKDTQYEQGMYVYDIRHADDDEELLATLENNVRVNCYGKFICYKDLNIKDYENIEDWNYV